MVSHPVVRRVLTETIPFTDLSAMACDLRAAVEQAGYVSRSRDPERGDASVRGCEHRYAASSAHDTLSLPIFPYLGDDRETYVCGAIRAAHGAKEPFAHEAVVSP